MRQLGFGRRWASAEGLVLMAGNPSTKNEDDTINDNNEVGYLKESSSSSSSKEKEEENEMALNTMHRSSSRPQLDLSGAAIQGNFEERNPTILLPNQSDDISHLALDIGGLPN